MGEQLGIPLEVVSTERSAEDFTGYTRRAARFTHLSSAPSGDDFAVGLATAATTAPYGWSGIPIAWVLEPVSKHNGYDAETGRWSFDVMLDQINGFDEPRWRQMRRAVEPLRPQLEVLLDRNALAALLPPPGHRLRSRKPLAAGSPIRLLAGLAFVLDQPAVPE